MVIFHSYVSLPEGIYYDPGIVSIYIWLQQRRLRQKKDVNLAKLTPLSYGLTPRLSSQLESMDPGVALPSYGFFCSPDFCW